MVTAYYIDKNKKVKSIHTLDAKKVVNHIVNLELFYNCVALCVKRFDGETIWKNTMS